MYRFLLRPKWLGFHLLCVAVIVAMVNLALWQLRRLDEKRAFNARVAASADAPVAAYDVVLAGGGDLGADELRAVEYRRVDVTGTYLDRTFEIVNVSQDGQSGHDQVAALALPDGTVLLVNRGFAPGATALPGLPTGEVRVTGRVRRSRSAGTGQTADDGTQQLTAIRRVDLAVLATQFDAELQPVYLEALAEDGAPLPGLAPVVAPSPDEGPHLSYAIQWCIFSVAVAAGWVLAVRRSASDRAEAAGTAPRKQRAKPLIPEQYL